MKDLQAVREALERIAGETRCICRGKYPESCVNCLASSVVPLLPALEPQISAERKRAAAKAYEHAAAIATMNGQDHLADKFNAYMENSLSAAEAAGKERA